MNLTHSSFSNDSFRREYHSKRNQLLEGWGIRSRQIGYEIGYKGMKDPEIITFLHGLNGTTFFTRDRDFFYRHLCHSNYCLINLNVNKNETVNFVRRDLRHSSFNTQAKRMGKVVRVTTERLHVWQLHAEQQEVLFWPAP